MKKRSDRFVCKLKDYDAKSIKVIGSDGGLGLQDRKENSVHPWDCLVSVDLLPSCHRGLVITIAPNGPARVGELDRESPEFIHVCKFRKKDAVILKLDFEKAFDKIEH
jgi:hypothetical protein